jgi:RND superfamily putative drug exporter
VPLLTIAVAVWVALKLLALCTLIPGFYLVNVSQIFAIVMLYGAGTDYCLFLISRYREELAAGKDKAEALRGGVSKVGGALVASAATVICGLGLMVLAEFAKVKSGGPAIALGLFVALAASLTLAPALLRLLGPALFWPRGVARETGPEADRRDLWDRVSRGVVRRPLLIWAASVALLLPLAWLGSQVRPNYRATGELSPSSSSVQGLEVLQRHFTAGETGPITVLLASRTDWTGPEGHQVLSQLSQGFARLENVAEVRSFTQPLGVPLRNRPGPEEANSLLARGFREVRGRLRNLLNEQARSAARPVYLSTVPAGSEALHWVKEPKAGSGPIHVARLDVVLKSDPFDAQSLPTLETIQAWVRQELPDSAKNLNGLAAETYGVTVGARDLATVTEADRSRINLLVLAGVFLILLVLVRKPWLAAYLLVTVLFSYFATLGATTLVGQWFFGRPLGDVDWRVPFFLFTILVAVGEDYNILLMDRAVKERHRHGAVEGMRLALARTGGTITSCGVIMAGTFATLMLAGLGTLVQIGFALAFGVLLDTFVVRPFLVPAFVILIWKRQAPGTAAEKMCLPRRQVA